MSYILTSLDHLPYDPLSDARKKLPGIAPLGDQNWLLFGPDFEAQMVEREALIAHQRANVIAVTDGYLEPAQELLSHVLDHLSEGYRVLPDSVVRPDGVQITLDWGDPMAVLGHLVQEDFCILDKRGDEHVLIAAVLCFPASWRLSEKIGRPLMGIHSPVPEYDESIAKRVQRLFDGVQAGKPIWRANALWYADPELFQPRSAVNPRVTNADENRYLRTERQIVLRLPTSKAVAFSIRTSVMKRGLRDSVFFI